MPKKTSASPTKPFSPGRPMLDSAMNTMQNVEQSAAWAHAAVVADLAGVVAFVEHADDQEQAAGRQAVVDHLQQTAGQAGAVEGEHAEHAEAQMADAAVGDQLLDVVLGLGAEAAVDDADDRQGADQRHADADAGVGGQRQAQPQEAVGAHLEQHAGQEHAAGRRRLDVGQRQPGVHREQRHLDREAGHHGQEDPELERSSRIRGPSVGMASVATAC